MKTYITFGQAHEHLVNDKTFDKDCVCEISAEDYTKARVLAFKAFGPKFAFAYPEDEFNRDSMKYYPRGIIPLNEET